MGAGDPVVPARTEHHALLTVFAKASSAHRSVPASSAGTTGVEAPAVRAVKDRHAARRASVNSDAKNNARAKSAELMAVEVPVGNVLPMSIAVMRDSA